MKPKNIDDVVGKPGSFETFLKAKKEHLQKREGKRQARVHSAKAARSMVWAAA